MAIFWRQWLNWQATPAQKAWAFHDALACGLAAMARDRATARGIDTVVCSGGVLHNRLLAARLTFIWRILLCCLRSSCRPATAQSPMVRR